MIVEFLKENYLSLTSVAISLVSIIIASKTLNHSKKTTIVIEKYEPLLKEVAIARTINIYEDKSFNFNELRGITNSYVYHALSSKLKKKINIVLVNAPLC